MKRPFEWKRARIDRVATVHARIGWKALTADEYQPNGFAFLATPNIKPRSIDFESVNYISRYRYEESPELKLQAGDVLLAKDGMTLGITNLVDRLPKPATVNGSIAILRPARVEPRFLRYSLASTQTQELIASLKNGMDVPHLFQWDIKRLPLDIPPPDEQRRIADFLDAETARIDYSLECRRQQLALLEERYKTAISEAIAPGISSVGCRSAIWPWLPDSVRVARLGYAARVQVGVTVHSARERTHDDAEYPYLRVANVQGEKVDLSKIKTILLPKPLAKRSTLLPGDVVMTEANGNPDNLGRGAVWTGEIPDMVHQNHIFAIRVDRQRIVPDYLSLLLASIHGRRYFRFTSNQVGIATTSSSKVLNFPVPLLSVEEQQSAVEMCQQKRDTTRDASAALDEQIVLLNERRQALITAAVTGQIDVTTAHGPVLAGGSVA